MEKMDVKEIQNCLFQMIKWFDQYAKENSIRYYLSGGTLLGAIRHHGFIPWDDDLDIMIPRPDYEKLIGSFNGERYKLICCEINKDYNTPFARIWDTKTIRVFSRLEEKEIGAFIDIFPIDGYPSNEMVSKIHSYILKYKRALINMAIRKNFLEKEKYQLVKKLMRGLYKKDGNYYCNRLNDFAKRYKYDTCRFVGVTTTTDHILLERNSKDIFRETVYMDFEDAVLPVPCGYDVYLKHLYGDYMKLPPVSQRISEHDYTLYWRD